jgi:hypothetical protein
MYFHDRLISARFYCGHFFCLPALLFQFPVHFYTHLIASEPICMLPGSSVYSYSFTCAWVRLPLYLSVPFKSACCSLKQYVAYELSVYLSTNLFTYNGICLYLCICISCIASATVIHKSYLLTYFYLHLYIYLHSQLFTYTAFCIPVGLSDNL